MLDSLLRAIGNHGCSGLGAISGPFAHTLCGSSVDAGAQGVTWLHPRGVAIAVCALVVVAGWGAVNAVIALRTALKNKTPAG